MKNKVGPYGSHYGTGCYTKNCSLRDAAAAGVKAPITYNEAQKQLDEANSKNINADSRKHFQDSETAVSKARLALYSTPEGQKILKSEIEQNSQTFGENHPVVISKKDLLQKAVNKHDRDTFEYRNDVFNASKSVASRDLKHLAQASHSFKFDKEKNAIVDKKTKRVFAQVDESGMLTVRTQTGKIIAAGAGTTYYDGVKKVISQTIKSDIAKNIKSQPTPTSKINDSLEKSYKVDKIPNQTGGYKVIVSDKSSNKRLALLEYDSNQVFTSASWAQKNGALSFPERNPNKILGMLENKAFTNNPELPDWIS